MKTSTAVLAALVAAGCKKQAAKITFPSARSQAPIAPLAADSASLTSLSMPPQRDAVRGKVTQKLDVAQYTYLELDGKTWVAVPKSDVAVGDTVAVAAASWMENFHSETLGRTWPRITFGTLVAGKVHLDRDLGAGYHYDVIIEDASVSAE